MKIVRREEYLDSWNHSTINLKQIQPSIISGVDGICYDLISINFVEIVIMQVEVSDEQEMNSFTNSDQPTCIFANVEYYLMFATL